MSIQGIGFAIRPFRSDDREAVGEQFLALNRYEEPLAGNRRVDAGAGLECLDAAMRRVVDTRARPSSPKPAGVLSRTCS